MKLRIILIVVFILNYFALGAQGYNAVRIAGGVAISSDADSDSGYSYKVGPSISIAYARSFNPYISVETEVYSGFVNNSDTAQSVSFDFDAKFMVTPMPKIFKYLELGIGPALRYDRYTRIYGEKNPETDLFFICSDVYDSRRILFGVDYCIRLYAIRNQKFDLFAFYEQRTNYSRDYHVWFLRSSNAGVAFGVKF